MSWCPIFPQITDSSVWELPPHIFKSWINILTKKDHETHVWRGNEYTLAREAKITLEQAREALKVLSEPDPASLSRDHDGKRILSDDGEHWWAVNGEKYKDMIKREIELENARNRTAKWRANKKSEESASKGPAVQTARQTASMLDDLPRELDSAAFRKAWDDFKTMRARKRKPVTSVASERLLKQCSAWGSVKAIRALDNSIANDWQGLFDPDKDRDGNPVKPPDDPRFVPGTTIPYFDNGGTQAEDDRKFDQMRKELGP